eukprot:6174776-Pleurochrysis_carterae.AAC.1
MPDGVHHSSKYGSRSPKRKLLKMRATSRRPTPATVALLEVMAAAAIKKMHDPDVVTDKLSSQDGAIAYSLHSRAHKATISAHNTNAAAVEARLFVD